MSGSSTVDKQLDLLEQVLDRVVHVDVALALANCFAPPNAAPPLEMTAFGLDANVLLRLAQRKATDLVDLLLSDRSGPLILPSQAIQEFWKNHDISYVPNVADRLSRAFERLKQELDRLDTTFEPFLSDARSLLEDFRQHFGHMLDPDDAGAVQSLLRQFATSGTLTTVPRSQFAPYAASRKKTKTPPGFEDSNSDGDFFIWVEFLHGLQMARVSGQGFTRAVLLTQDKKKDWSRRNIAHPVLVAEVRALLDVELELWTIDEFAEHVAPLLADEK